MKEFNTTAVCIPSKHYMVDLSERVKEIRKLINAGKYFTINRARQYGKTTTIAELCDCLADSYDVISLDFQDVTDGILRSGAANVTMPKVRNRSANILITGILTRDTC